MSWIFHVASLIILLPIAFDSVKRLYSIKYAAEIHLKQQPKPTEISEIVALIRARNLHISNAARDDIHRCFLIHQNLNWSKLYLPCYHLNVTGGYIWLSNKFDSLWRGSSELGSDILTTLCVNVAVIVEVYCEDVSIELYPLTAYLTHLHVSCLLSLLRFLECFNIKSDELFLRRKKANFSTQLDFSVAVDMTASNGCVTEPSSLHFIGGSRPNEYHLAIRAVADICQHYNNSKTFDAMGFGAKIPPQNFVNHCFPLVRLSPFVWRFY